MPGVHERENGVQPELAGDLVVDEEGLRDRGRVGQPGGLDEDVVEPVPAAHQRAEDADQVPAHGAADAAVVHLEDLFFGVDDQSVVYTDLTELVFDHGDALAVFFGEDPVEQRGLAAAEEAGEHSHRDLGGLTGRRRGGVSGHAFLRRGGRHGARRTR